MPSRKNSKSKSGPNINRGRSRSVGLVSSRSRSRTPTRSQSRSKGVAKGNRTPASESTVKRRRSPSPSSSSSGSVSISRRTNLKGTKSVPDASGDRRTKSIHNDTTPTRFSQRLVQRIEHRSTTEERIGTSPCSSSAIGSGVCYRLSTIFGQWICPSPILALFCLITFFPLILWLNLLVLSSAGQDSKTFHGATYPFAGIMWPTDWRVYFDYRCHLFVIAYLLAHALIARVVPIGYKADCFTTARQPERRLNGLFTLIFFCGIYAFAQSHTWTSAWFLRPSVLLPKYWFSLLVATGNVALVTSLTVYMISRRIPRSQVSYEGNTGNFFVDFWIGRSVRPRWFGLDWKILSLRPGSVALLFFGITYAIAQWEQFGRVSPALLALVTMHSVFITDLFAFEYTLAHTFETLHEGFGYFAITARLLFPFIYSLGPVYLSSRPNVGRLRAADNDFDYPNVVLLGLSAVLFLTGYWIYRASNNQKDLFRRQSNHPSVADLDKISGPNSQRFLAGGWWGIVRHPNYLGNLMMAYAQALPSGFSSFIPWFYPVFLTCFMLHRIWRTEYINTEKYGAVMIMYKRLVPCRLIPRIF